MKLIFLFLGITACGVTDDRPETLAYITEAILAPNCATAECHSSMKKQYGYAFDSVAAAQDSMSKLIDPCFEGVPCAPGKSFLITVLTVKDTQNNRMPLDAPLANKDIAFIAQWIENGAFGYERAGN